VTALRRVGWLAGLAGTIWWLATAGSWAPLPAPDPAAVADWAGTHPPAALAAALVRAVALLATGYLTVVSVVLLTTNSGRRVMRPVLGARFVAVALGISLVPTTAAAARTTPTIPPPAVIEVVATPVPAPGTIELVGPLRPVPAPVVMELLAPEPPAHDSVPTTPTPVDGDNRPAGAAPPAYVVQPGDHLWGIASDALAAHLGSTPTDRQLWPYYRAVLDANVDRLVVPDEPDLIYPGQTFVLPPPTGPVPTPIGATGP
jgi:nucleoid-associated protein YgaU